MIEAGERRLRPILMTALATMCRHDPAFARASARDRRCCSPWPLR